MVGYYLVFTTVSSSSLNTITLDFAINSSFLAIALLVSIYIFSSESSSDSSFLFYN